MTDQEIISTLKDLLAPINRHMQDIDLKMSEMQIQIDTMRLDMKSSERAIRKDIHYLNDSVDTLVEVLETKDILPKVK